MIKPPWPLLTSLSPTKPTIPFLLGALRHPPGALAASDRSKTELRALLLAMRDEAPDGCRVRLSVCNVIGHLVVEVEPDGPMLPGTARFPSTAKPDRMLLCGPGFGLGLSDFEDLVVELWIDYGDHISGGRFTFREKQWRPFDVQEIDQIKQSLMPGEHGEA